MPSTFQKPHFPYINTKHPSNLPKPPPQNLKPLIYFFNFPFSLNLIHHIYNSRMNSFRSCCALPIIGFMFMALLSLSYGQQEAPAPSPTSDGKFLFRSSFYGFLMDFVVLGIWVLTDFCCGILIQVRR